MINWDFYFLCLNILIIVYVEPDAKKGPGSIGAPQQSQGPPIGGPPMGGRPNSNLNQGNMVGGPGMGGPTHSEDMKVPDKMVGLSKCLIWYFSSAWGELILLNGFIQTICKCFTLSPVGDPALSGNFCDFIFPSLYT